MAPSNYLNKWFLISKVLWHSPEGKCTVNEQAIILYNEFENDTLKNYWSLYLPGDNGLTHSVQWVNS